MRILLALFGIICAMMGIIVAPSDIDSASKSAAVLIAIFGFWLIWLATRTNKKRNVKENSELKAQYEQLQSEYRQLQLQHSQLQEENNNALSQIKEIDNIKNSENTLLSIKNEIRELNQEAICSQYIFSDYDGLTSEECKNELALLKMEEQAYIKNSAAVKLFCDSPKRELNSNVKQILRCFNSECDNVLLNLSVKTIDTARNKITKSFETLNKLFSVDGVQLEQKLLQYKLDELNLVYTYELKKEQEREQQRAIKEQMIEEEKVRREIERQKAKLEKDQAQCSNEINRLMGYMQKTQDDVEKQLYIDKIKELEEKLKQLEADKATVLEREANARAGYVYVISNIGSFGENVYKIGMTRRLEPMDRVKELGSASVPFEFDVHAMIFSDDAPALETALHQAFEKQSVNRVNLRKEFFRVSLDDIEKVVKDNFNNAVKFTRIPVAKEYNETLEILKQEQSA